MKGIVSCVAIAATGLLGTFIPLCSARVAAPPLHQDTAIIPVGTLEVDTKGLRRFVEVDEIFERDADGNATTLAGPSPITDDVWQKMVSKGCNILQACAANDGDAAEWVGRSGTAESPYQNFPRDLDFWGYKEQDALVAFRRVAPDYQEAYAALGLDPAKELGDRGHGPNVVVAYLHDEDKTIDNVVYKKTEANFRTIINTKDAVIIGWYKFGPAYNGGMQPPAVTTLPKLKNWSDIAFLSWKAQGGSGNLKYIWSAQISNTIIPGLLGRALVEGKRKDDNLDKTKPFDEDKECDKFRWKDQVAFSMSSDAGKALLGSPNGRGAGHLLLEHKSTFGEKTTLSHVTFYCSGKDDEEINFIFHVQT
ncbi:hypothetical protein K491DRAFT_745228 [Lophiostoma macrostomum CBS 122681]|uniref:Uncharacterized protein n=1 Tax=Lophiostoma macrostomum CBS 122681 TaxID=1314788 RepID=A0A6A6T8V1_9PLEO|nr:hypothetical protein K491DRAFT_745228 [Lophiostoma macrostomum CBS 122681]